MSFPKPCSLDVEGPQGGSRVTGKVRRAYLDGMQERLARIEKDIAKALGDGDLARVRRLSKQWSRLWLLNHAEAVGGPSPVTGPTRGTASSPCHSLSQW